MKAPRFKHLPKETRRPPLTQQERAIRFTYALVQLGTILAGLALLVVTSWLVGITDYV